jgi:hypothetical protein
MRTTREKTVRIVEGRFIFKFPFDAQVVEELKSRIPPHARRWNSSTKEWAIDPPHHETMHGILRSHLGWFPAMPTEGPDPEVAALRAEVCRLREQLRRAEAVPESYKTLHLQPTAPREVINAVHKTLTKLHHPDAGGDTLTMQAINAAADQLRKGAC